LLPLAGNDQQQHQQPARPVTPSFIDPLLFSTKMIDLSIMNNNRRISVLHSLFVVVLILLAGGGGGLSSVAADFIVDLVEDEKECFHIRVSANGSILSYVFLLRHFDHCDLSYRRCCCRLIHQLIFVAGWLLAAKTQIKNTQGRF
jgi:hypothetical protein